jgi:hypothetical protein
VHRSRAPEPLPYRLSTVICTGFSAVSSALVLRPAVKHMPCQGIAEFDAARWRSAKSLCVDRTRKFRESALPQASSIPNLDSPLNAIMVANFIAILVQLLQLVVQPRHQVNC